MTNEQNQIVEKYVTHYSHLKHLADNAKADPAAEKTLGDQIGRLACPPSVSPSELLAVSKLGFAQ
jgi:hypothetical protein